MRAWDLPSVHIASRLGWTLVHSLWEGGLVAAAVAVALEFLRRRSPQARYFAALAGLAAIVGSACVTFRLCGSPESTGESRSLVATAGIDAGRPTGTQSDHSASDSPGTGALPERGAAAANGSSVRLPTTMRRFEAVLPWLAALWSLGVLALCVWHVGGWVAAQRLRVIGVREPGDRIVRLSGELSTRLGIDKPVRVAVSLLAQTPMVVGWLRPVVLLPVALVAGLTPRQLEGILAHELAHIRRHDYLLNLLQVAAETLLFYHPAVWWISRHVRLERERCCDEAAVGACGNRSEYAQSLAELAEIRLRPQLALGAGGSAGPELLARIRAILRLDDEAPRPAARLAVAAAVLLLAAAAPIPLLRSQPATSAPPASLPAGPATFRAECVLSEVSGQQRKVLATPSLNLDETGAVGFLFTGRPPVIVRRQPGSEPGIFGTVRVEQQPGGGIHVVCRLERVKGERGEQPSDDQAALTNLTAKLIASQIKLMEVQAILRNAQRELDRRQSSGDGNGSYTAEDIARVSPDLRAKVNARNLLEAQYQSLLERYGMNYPTVMESRRLLELRNKEIADAVKRFNDQCLIIRHPDRSPAEAVPKDLSKLQALRDDLQKEYDAQVASVRSMTAVVASVGAVQTNQSIKPGERVAVELDDGTRLEVLVRAADR